MLDPARLFAAPRNIRLRLEKRIEAGSYLLAAVLHRQQTLAASGLSRERSTGPLTLDEALAETGALEGVDKRAATWHRGNDAVMRRYLADPNEVGLGRSPRTSRGDAPAAVQLREMAASIESDLAAMRDLVARIPIEPARRT